MGHFATQPEGVEYPARTFMKLTPHFTFLELINTSHKDLLAINKTSAEKIKEDIYKLALFAEQVRAILSVPMTITSGYRCKELNKAVGGSSTSQHTKAEAIDFIPSKMTVSQAYDKLRTSCLVYGQLIIEHSGSKEWVHVSMGYKKENLKYNNGKYTKGE